jgi:hypothetical protein
MPKLREILVTHSVTHIERNGRTDFALFSAVKSGQSFRVGEFRDVLCARYSGAEGEVTQQELDLLVILELTKGRGCDSELSSASDQGQQDLLRGLGPELPAECDDFPVVLCRCRCALCGKDCRKEHEVLMTLHSESLLACENCRGHSYSSYWPQQTQI